MKKACHRHLTDLTHGLPAFAWNAPELISAVTCIKYKFRRFAGVFQHVCLCSNATFRNILDSNVQRQLIMVILQRLRLSKTSCTVF